MGLRICSYACSTQHHAPSSKHTPMPSTCRSSPMQSAPTGQWPLLCSAIRRRQHARCVAYASLHHATAVRSCCPPACPHASHSPSLLLPPSTPSTSFLQHTHNHPACRSTAERPADWGRARALPCSSLRELCNEIPSHLYTPPRALIFLTLTSHMYMSSPLWWCLEPGFGSHHKGVSLAMARRTRT